MVGCWCARSSWLTKDSVLKFEAVVGDGGLLPLVGVGLWFCWAEGLDPQLLLEMVDLFITKTFRLMETRKSSNMSETKWSWIKKIKHQCGFYNYWPTSWKQQFTCDRWMCFKQRSRSSRQRSRMCVLALSCVSTVSSWGSARSLQACCERDWCKAPEL